MENLKKEPEIIPQEGFVFYPIYGWVCLGVAVIIFYYWNKIQDYLDARYARRQQQLYDAKCHKDPDWVKSHHEGMEQARRRMQEQYEAKKDEHLAKVKQKEEQKRLELAAKYSQLEKGAYRLADHGQGSSKSDYNPLMGDSGGRYKPPKRTGCSGGGCG